MKKLKLFYSIAFFAAILVSCETPEGVDKDVSFLNSAISSDYAKIFDISTDNSGKVRITPLANGGSSFLIAFGHGTGAAATATVAAGTSAIHTYPEGNYTVSITTYSISGNATTTTYPLVVTYRAPENLNVTVNSDMSLTATANYTSGFKVYYGDVANETGTLMTTTVNSSLLATGTLPAHIYPAGGPYQLKVVALSGGAATTVYTKTLFGFPLDFESPTMDYFFGTFGNVNFSKVANPSATGLNTSATVGKYEKTTGAASWSGTYSPLNIPINFAHGKKVKMLVYNPVAANIGKKVNVELEAAVSGTGATANGVAVLKTAFTTSGAWEELVFDFSTITAIPATARFGQLVLRFDDGNAGTGEVFYVDNIRITN